MTTDLILGTAGHIDHGKTSLIRALTGVDTDRLPEEKKRGITIELGFAELVVGDYRLGIVDVPGHERFVRNMLAGATGMDLAMLVVAADDSVKQQTREHLEILRLLNLPAGVIVLTKCDLVDSDWIDLVEHEIRELVSGSFLDQAPIVRTSSHTGLGLDELKTALAQAAARVAGSDRIERVEAPFRLAIDRTFTIDGHGTVVTGSAGSGRARVGDELLLQPGETPVRIRSLQNHDRAVEEIHRGQRAAINLAGVHHDQIQRGQELCSPGHLQPSRLLTVSLMLLKSAPRAVKSRSRMRLHVGTAELIGSLVLLDRDKLEPGETGAAQLFLSEPAVTTWNQPFVVRSESPVVTIGGGQVLVPNAERIRQPDGVDLEMIERLRGHDSHERASAALYFSGLREWKPQDLTRTAGIKAVEEAHRGLLASGDLLEIRVSASRTIRLHRLVVDRLGERIVVALQTMHEQNPLRSTLDRSRFVSGFRYVGDEALIHAVLERLRKAGRITLTEKAVALAGHGPKLSQNEHKLLGQLVELYRAAGIQTPTVKEFQQQTTRNQDSVPQLIAIAASNGDLVEVTPEYYLHADVCQQLQASLAEKLAASNGLTLSEIREILNTTRKYAVPLCEYLDRIGFTKRQGDLRVLASKP